MKEGRKPEYLEITPGDELQKMRHTTFRRFKPQARLEPTQQHWWQARKADVLTVTPHVTPVTALSAQQAKMEAATPRLQPVRQPPQTEQARAGHSVQADSWTQQTYTHMYSKFKVGESEMCATQTS